MTWAPPPAEPFAAPAGARARPAADRDDDALAGPRRAGRPGRRSRPSRTPAALLESLGHEVVEADPPWARPELSAVFTASFGPAVCTQIRLAEMIAGRAATADDMEPLSWALYELCKGINSVDALLAEFQLHGVGRALVTAGSRSTTRC